MFVLVGFRYLMFVIRMSGFLKKRKMMKVKINININNWTKSKFLKKERRGKGQNDLKVKQN